MHVEQDEAARSGTASYSASLTPDEFEGTAPEGITVVIASGREALHAKWCAMLTCAPDITVKGDPIGDAARLPSTISDHQPRVLLLDKALLNQLDSLSLQKLREQSPPLRVLLLGDNCCNELVTDVLRNRFHGFLPATCQPAIGMKAIRSVINGELWLSRSALAVAVTELTGLSDPCDFGPTAEASRVESSTLTPREMQVVALLRRGCINKEIAQELGIMEDTVKKHLQSIFSKLGVRRRAMVALWQLRNTT